MRIMMTSIWNVEKTYAFGFWEIDEPIDRQKMFHKFLKDLTTPEDSVRERKEVQEEDKEEVEASQQEKHKEAAEESQRPMDNCK